MKMWIIVECGTLMYKNHGFFLDSDTAENRWRELARKMGWDDEEYIGYYFNMRTNRMLILEEIHVSDEGRLDQSSG